MNNAPSLPSMESVGNAILESPLQGCTRFVYSLPLSFEPVRLCSVFFIRRVKESLVLWQAHAPHAIGALPRFRPKFGKFRQWIALKKLRTQDLNANDRHRKAGRNLISLAQHLRCQESKMQSRRIKVLAGHLRLRNARTCTQPQPPKVTSTFNNALLTPES